MIQEEIVHVRGIPKKLIVFLHGYLDDCCLLNDRVQPLLEMLDDYALHIPQAPCPCEVGKGMRQWYSMYRFDPHYERRDTPKFNDFISYYDRMTLGLEEAHQYLLPYLEQTLAEYNLSYDDLILCGFSQGAMVAIYTALMSPEKISGLISFSGVLAGAHHLLKNAQNKPNALLIHGGDDKSLRPESLEFTRENLQKIGCQVQTYLANHGQHEISLESLQTAAQFIKAI